MNKEKSTVIKDTPADILDDQSFQNAVMQHVNAFGFENVIENVVEAYRGRARRLNKKADELEKQFKRKL